MSPLPSFGAKRWRAWGRMVALGAVVFAAGISQALAQAENSIDTLTVSKGTSGRTIVKFTLKNPIANPPAGFAINNPPRIALDFLDTGNGLGRTSQDVSDPALRSMNVVRV